MHSKSILFHLALFIGLIELATGYASTPQEEQAYLRLQVLSARDLNIATPQLEDSLLNICREVESQARNSGNISREFKAGQVETNTHGLMGNYGLASNKAQELFEKARKINDHLALGLALQAIGDTYMHTEQFAQADSAFSEATPYIARHGEPYMKLQLHLQHLNVYQNLLDRKRLEESLGHLPRMLAADSTLPGIETYSFLYNFHLATAATQMHKLQQAAQLLAQLRQQKPDDGYFDLWIHYLATFYHFVAKEYDKALVYSDSTIMDKYTKANTTNLRSILIARSLLLEKMDRDEEACSLYLDIHHLSDSLYKTSYTAQIDSLHTTYWTDHLQMASITHRNTLYAKLIGVLLGLVMIGIAAGIFVRRKNRQLIDSRQQLEQLRKTSADSIHTKSLFLSNMSHELRTPLNAITGFSGLLTDNEELDEETRQQCSDYIRQNADLLMKLISDIVDFSELQDTAISFTWAPCDVLAVCRNVISTIDNVKRTEARIQFISEPEQLELNTDKNRLQQVLINLLINATKFTREGSITLRLATDPQRNEAIFTVEDTGCGIPLEKQPHIFERFEKLHEGVQGAGLGLSICKLIVDHTGGRIWIDPGYTIGARFVFTHPLHLVPKK